MPGHRLLFLEASRLTAYRWRAAHLDVEGVFTPDEMGLDAFAEYLAKGRHAVFHLLADVAEEGFQIEDVPFVRGADRSALIERKLGQYFYGTPLSVAFSLGRAKEGRRDEKILFAALTRPQLFEPWLAVLRRAETRLAGVYSVPLTLPALARDLSKSHPRLLLVTVTGGGLRQTFIQDGRLHFSRLTPLATDTIDEMAVAANLESGKMWHYLAGQRLIGRGTPLTTVVLVHPAQQAAFRARCVDTDELRFEFLDILAEGKRRGLKSPPADSRAETLFLHLLVASTPSQQFAPEAERRYFRFWQAQFGLRSAGLVVFAACLLFAAKQGVDYLSVTGDTADQQARLQNDRQRYDSALEALPKIPLNNDNLRALIGRYDGIDKLAAGPQPAYVLLSHALRDSPKVDLTGLDWSLASGPEGAAAAGGRSPAPGPAQGRAAYVAMEVRATLPLSMAADRRAQLETINAFADRLRGEPGVQVTVLSMPFEIESGKSLKSGGDRAGEVAAPRFALRVVQKP